MHGTVQEPLLIEQLPEPHCSTFSQFLGLSVRKWGDIRRKYHLNMKNQMHYKEHDKSTWSKWMPLTKAALATTGFLSTMACFKYRSICVSRVPSVIRQSTRMAFARYISVLLFISFISELVTIITCRHQHEQKSAPF